MNAFVGSLKDDLLDRRRLPIVALLGVLLLAAVAYAVLSGGGSSAPPAPSAAATGAPLGGSAGIAVSAVKENPDQAVAETTNGSQKQHGGALRNPFTALPGSKSTASAATASASAGSSATGSAGSAGGSSSSSSGSSESATTPSQSRGGSGGSSPAKTPASTSPKKEARIYQVTALFGIAPAGTPVLDTQLTPYEHLKREQPLPNSAQPLVVFRGVGASGKSATFTLVGEAILRGEAVCLPSASQCQSIDLKPDQTEELEYIPLGGTAITYQLRVASIEPVAASAARARSAFRSESKAGLKLLRRAGLAALPGLHYSPSRGSS